MLSYFKSVIVLMMVVFLSSCQKDADTQSIQTLEFNQIHTIEGLRLWQATGFTSSPDLQSLFIVSRESNPSNGISSERVIRYNVKTGEQKITYFELGDFISKEAHIVDNQLIVIGGTYLNSYDTSLDMETTSMSHGLSLSRFGSVVYKNEIYVWGGDLNAMTSHLIRKWNSTENKFEIIASLPAASTWSKGAVVNERLYIFGGQMEFENTPSSSVIYIYDFVNSTITTSQLPEKMFRTFTAKYNGLIYVAGHKDDNEGLVFGKFDPETHEFTKLNIEVDIPNNEQFNIYQMTVLDDKLYLLFGKGEVLENMEVLEANLD